jgi:hypothetical protein
VRSISATLRVDDPATGGGLTDRGPAGP